MSAIYWREPLWLLAALYPLLLWGWTRWRRGRMRRACADPGLWPWVEARLPAEAGGILQRGLLAAAWLLAVVALAGPRAPLEVPQAVQPDTGALVAVVDLSRSMDVRDSGGSRRAAALRLVESWNREPGRPPLGVVLFAGRAHLLFPPTADASAAAHLLEQARDLVLPTLGNDLAGALQLGARVLDGVDGPRGLVLLSDGDLDQAARSAAETLLAELSRSDGVRLAVVGIGVRTASAVPDPVEGWLSVDGRAVLSRLEAGWLAQLAQAAGGSFTLAATGAGTPALAGVWQSPPPRIASADRQRVLWLELFRYALVPALLLLLAALFAPTPRTASAMLLAGPGLALGLALSLAPPPAAAQDAADAYAALAAGDPAQARRLYRGLPGFSGRFGEGVACFRLEDWACAAEAFASAAWLAADDRQRARAAYNLAATRFRAGDFDQAAVLYRDARALGLAHPSLDPLVVLSETLAEQVAERRRQAEGRAGRGGATSAGEPPDTEAVDRALEQAPPAPVPLPEGLDRSRFDDLVARGLERARLAAAGEAGAGQPRRWFGGEAVAGERPGAALWQRLFEIEEGFPAPLEQPRARPGERPW